MASPRDQLSRLVDLLATEFATAMGALLGAVGAAAPVASAPGAGWFVRIGVSGVAAGRITVGVDRADAASLSKTVMGFDEPPDDAAVIDLLQEVANQAIGALSQRPEAAGLRFGLQGIDAAEPPDLGGEPRAFALSLTDAFAPVVTCWVEADSAEPPAPPLSIVASAPPVTASALDTSAGRAYPNLDVILDIDLPLSVRFGETEMTLDALTKIGPGSVIELGRSPDDPVDILVNGRLIARGEVVVVAGSYGVRVNEVVSAVARLRSLAS